MSVLIISRTENLHATEVAKSLCNKGHSSTRIDVDQINHEPPMLTTRMANGLQTTLINGIHINPIEYPSVFVHHPRIDIDSDQCEDEIDRKLTAASWSNALAAIETTLDDALWINRPSAFRISAQPFHQLKLASECGFRVPATCNTNNLDDIKDFASSYKQVILKSGPLTGLHLQGQRILASLVAVDELTYDDLSFSPCFFQEYIPKDFELRVNTIGERVLTCRIDSQANPHTQIDWRNYDIPNTPHSAFNLDVDTQERCVNIAKRLGLEMGVLDLIVTPEGEKVFLECNSQGHWLWIEQLTGLAITDTVTGHLLSRVNPIKS